MKSNQVSVLVVLLLCLVMGGFLYVVDRSSDKEAGWTPSELYGELGARSYEGSSFSDVTFSGGASSDGVAVSMRNGSFSSLRTRVRRASSPSSLVANGVPGKSADFWGALSPNSPIASSPNSLIGHMTSSAEFHSFGGGSNMTMGSYASSSNGLIASSPAIDSYSPSPSSPIALSPNASGVGFNNLPSLQGGDGGRPVVSAEQALMSASSSASGLFGSALQNTYGAASYGDYVGMSSGQPSGVRGRQNATPGVGGGGSTYADWLSWFDEVGYAYGTPDGSGGYTFDNAQAEAAYAAWLASRSPSMPYISYPEWLSWLLSKSTHTGNGGNSYTFVPVGGVEVLIVLAFIYALILFVKRYKTTQL